jgi:hypothetical protein
MGTCVSRPDDRIAERLFELKATWLQLETSHSYPDLQARIQRIISAISLHVEQKTVSPELASVLYEMEIWSERLSERRITKALVELEQVLGLRAERSL